MHGRSNPYRRVMLSSIGKDEIRHSPGSQGIRTSAAVPPDESGLLLSQAIDTQRAICYKHWCLSPTTAEPCRSSSVGVPRLESQPRVC